MRCIVNGDSVDVNNYVCGELWVVVFFWLVGDCLFCWLVFMFVEGF